MNTDSETMGAPAHPNRRRRRHAPARARRVIVVMLLVAACLVGALSLLVHLGAVPYFEARLFVTHDSATATPAAYGVAYRTMTIDSHGRTLRAWSVDAGARTPAILFFHGNGQTIHDLAGIQAYLYRHAVSSMVFDYSGFGRSTGRATVRDLNQDAVAAWKAFVAWSGPARARFAVGYSLGTGILLHNVSRFVTRPDGIAVYGAFSSAKAAILHLHDAPAWLAPLAPDVWNSVAAAARLGSPLLVVAGADDTIVPPAMGRAVATAASHGAGGRYVLIPGVGHDAVVSHMQAVWSPIIAFMRACERSGTDTARASPAGSRGLAGQSP